MRRNLLREKLNAGKPTVGTHILSAWPTLVELIGHSKQYDYVEFTAEYAPFTMHDLDNLGRSLDRKSTRLNSSHIPLSRMPSSA